MSLVSHSRYTKPALCLWLMSRKKNRLHEPAGSDLMKIDREEGCLLDHEEKTTTA